VTLCRVLVELTVTEQRYRAVLEVQAGVPVIEVAERFGVSRQAVHRWVRWYRDEGLDGLSDRSHRPHAHPAQTSLEVEAAICELRRNHPRGQRRLQFELGRNGCPGPIPGLTAIYRVLVRHGLIQPVSRRRRREDYQRWQREMPMELGNWTSSAASSWPTAARQKWSPGWTIIPGSASSPPWSERRRAVRCAWRLLRRCNASASRTRYSATMASSSLAASTSPGRRR